MGKKTKKTNLNSPLSTTHLLTWRLLEYVARDCKSDRLRALPPSLLSFLQDIDGLWGDSG